MPDQGPRPVREFERPHRPRLRVRMLHCALLTSSLPVATTSFRATRTEMLPRREYSAPGRRSVGLRLGRFAQNHAGAHGLVSALVDQDEAAGDPVAAVLVL